MVNSFQDMIQNEQYSSQQTTSGAARQPLKPIDRLTKPSNVLQEIQNSSPYICNKQQNSTGSAQVEYPFTQGNTQMLTWEKFKQKDTIMQNQGKSKHNVGVKKLNTSNESN